VIILANKEEATKKSGNNKTIMIIVIAVVVLVGLGIVGRIASQYMARKAAGGFLSALTGGKANVNLTGDEVTVKDKDGNEITIGGEGAKLPKEYPSSIPEPKNGKVITSWSSTTDERIGISVIWEVSDSVDSIYESYKQAIENAGFKITGTFSADDTMTFTFVKNGEEEMEEGGTIGVGKGDGGKTNVTLMYGANK